MSRLHRFYVGTSLELKANFWLHDLRIVRQWKRVLRYQAGQQVILFDGVETERLYRIVELKDDEAHLELITDFERQLPRKDVYLLWALLKKDKNDWVLQKCTELGVSHFIPLLADRSEKTGFNEERAEKIVIEAAEQCGRSDIPTVREPMHIQTAIKELKGKVTLLICEQDGEGGGLTADPVGVFIGPEGGWSDAEKEMFTAEGLGHINLHNFTLRAETAAVAAATILQ